MSATTPATRHSCTLCLCEYFLSPQTLLLGEKIHYLGSFTGTFVNPNTAATYFGVLLLLSLSLSLRLFDDIQIHRGAATSAQSQSDTLTFVAYAIVTSLFGLALLLTKSRGGILSALAAVLFFTVASRLTSLRPRRARFAILGSGALSGLAAVGLFLLYGGLVLERIRTQGLEDEGRLCTYRATWSAIKDNLWLGTGLGTFQDVFPAYRLPSCGLYGYWEMAHSVFLEAWLALGAGFLICLPVIYYSLITSYARGLRARRRFRFVPLAALSILLLLTLHSLVDFSLQIPGVATVVAAVLGSGAAISLAPARNRKSSRSSVAVETRAHGEHPAVT
jgi:O-antigen ligase